MNNLTDFVLYDSLNNKISNGKFTGSIISKCKDKIIFSDNMTISNSNQISISQGLIVGFEEKNEKVTAFSKKTDFIWKNLEEAPLEYSVLISENTVEQYNQEQFTDDFQYYCWKKRE